MDAGLQIRRHPFATALGVVTLLAIVLAGIAPSLVLSSMSDDGAPAADPARPIARSSHTTVFLLGGSAARESIVGDGSWSRQLRAMSGHDVRAFDLGSSNETFRQDIGLVDAMPKEPTIVLIGVDLGRYTLGQNTEPAPLGLLVSGATVVHRYTTPDRTGRSESAWWAQDRYPMFERNYAYNQRQLTDLVSVCRRRGFHPVLLQLPLDLADGNATLDGVLARDDGACRRLAAADHVPFVDFLPRLRLPDADYHDLFHLIAPGRQVWQTRLSRVVSVLLRRDR